ncbi:hypothetical protein CTZ28_45090 [Streptomyces shenzhenensis]|uniref:Uncharacterized protein n=1 Tax=Streptomyces shenzhenensis TaxID=943815 RepID=A0A3M0HTW9_9ACTN|nr:hypothetical protein CTZ28_45090 [Streptomyces shenzhenensis]
MLTRSTAVTVGIAAAAALAATGITYASATSTSAQTAPAALQAAPVQAPFDGNDEKGNEGNEEKEEKEGRGKGFEKGFEKRFEKGFDEGRIHINERTYSSHPDGCITVVSGLGAKTLNIRNDSRKTVEVFRGAVCDNGAPIATVGPHSSSTGVKPHKTKGFFVKDGVLGSFRVIKEHGFKY